MFEKIPIPFENFTDKLNNNSKILFSGVFGSGKTTFINDFFNNNADYESVHIYPVNYSIATNKDIFELIKYDILFQLIGKVPKDDFLKLEIPYQLTLFTYLNNSYDIKSQLDFFTSFMNFAGKYGVAALKIYEQLKNLKDKYVIFHEQFQEDDFKKIQEYLEQSTVEKGHIYEEDLFTEIIRILVTQIKDKKKKKLVFVIDDLDRLDPDHIFRILNIFSAHIDFAGSNSDNKFNFDKVILISDYNNIESVYRHRYGLDTDFKGYINKFFNTIYWHDTSSLIKSIIGLYLRSIKTNVSYNIFDKNYRLDNQLQYILNILLDIGVISFRDLINYKNRFDINGFYSLKAKNLNATESLLRRYGLTTETTIYFLINFFDNSLELLKVIDKAKRINIKSLLHANNEYYLDEIAEFALLINHEKFNLEGLNSQDDKFIQLDYNAYSFESNINISRLDHSIKISCNKVSYNSTEISAKELNYFQFLEEATKVFIGIIK